MIGCCDNCLFSKVECDVDDMGGNVGTCCLACTNPKMIAMNVRYIDPWYRCEFYEPKV